MTESTRVGRTGNVEVHLKSRLQITSEIVNEIATLPDSAPWYVLTRNDSAGWQRENSFESFEAADEYFVTICGNNGINADRLMADGRGPNAHEVGP